VLATAPDTAELAEVANAAHELASFDPSVALFATLSTGPPETPRLLAKTPVTAEDQAC
jgi:hypothetical protein